MAGDLMFALKLILLVALVGFATFGVGIACMVALYREEKKERVKAEAEVVRLRGLIVGHHNATEAHKIQSGQLCPICMKEEKRMAREEKND